MRTKLYDPFLPVRVEKLLLPGGVESSRSCVIVDTEDGNQLEAGYITSGYELVPNHQVVEVAKQIMESTNLGNTEPLRLMFDGKKFRASYALNEEYGITDVPDVGDIIPTLDLVNSYDGSTRFGFQINAQELVCSNGMMVSHFLGDYTFRHDNGSGFLLDEAGEQLQRILNGGAFDRLGMKLVRMLEQEFTASQIAAVLVNIADVCKLGDATIGRVVKKLEGETKWELYRAFTNVFSHEHGFAPIRANRKVSRYFLDAA